MSLPTLSVSSVDSNLLLILIYMHETNVCGDITDKK